MGKNIIYEMRNLLATIMSMKNAELRLAVIMTALDYTLAESGITIKDVLGVRNEVIKECGEV